MERYWCLRWLQQENARQVDAVVLKDEVLRLVDIPLVIRLPGMPQTARGAQVRLDILRWDEVDLTVEARLLEVLNVVTDIGEEELEDDNEAALETADALDVAEEQTPAATLLTDDAAAAVPALPEAETLSAPDSNETTANP
jgi:exoribonuclease-2